MRSAYRCQLRISRYNSLLVWATAKRVQWRSSTAMGTYQFSINITLHCCTLFCFCCLAGQSRTGRYTNQIMVASEGKDRRIIYAETSMPRHTAKRARPSWSLRVGWNWSLDLLRTRQCGSVGAVMQLSCIHAPIPHNISGRVAQTGHSTANQRPVRHSKRWRLLESGRLQREIQ